MPEIVTPGTLPYHAPDDFTLICYIAYEPIVMAAKNNLPVKTVKDFVDYAKKHPEGLVAEVSAAVSVPNRVALEILNVKDG